jgi:peroxiredoxin
MRSNRLAAISRGILVTFLLGFAGASSGSEQPPTLTIGSPLPAFSLPGVDGKNYTDQSFKDANILMLVFTCAHCPTAQAYQERIKRLVTEYSPKGVKLVAINPNHADSVRLDELAYSDLSDSFPELQERAKQEKFNFVWLDDGPKQELSQKMGPVATPHVFIFDKARKLRFEGRIDDSERESSATKHDTVAALDALLAGRSRPSPRRVSSAAR